MDYHYYHCVSGVAFGSVLIIMLVLLLLRRSRKEKPATPPGGWRCETPPPPPPSSSSRDPTEEEEEEKKKKKTNGREEVTAGMTSSLTKRQTCMTSSSSNGRQELTGCRECRRRWNECFCTVTLYRHEPVAINSRPETRQRCSSGAALWRTANETDGAILRTPLVPTTTTRACDVHQTRSTKRLVKAF